MGSHAVDDDPAQAVEAIKVAIVGAGAAGLFTGMIFDHLNATVPNFKVEYDILEAAPKERAGGRLFTHLFSEEPHDYFDVGAMGFPENPVMDRNDDKDAGHREPWCFNNVTKWGNSDVIRAQAEDQESFNLNREGKIPKNLMNENPADIMDYLTEDIRSKLRTDLEGLEFKDAGWKELMRQYDSMSTRDFLRLGTHPEKFKDGSNMGPFNHNTVEWMEIFNGGTNWYDQAHSETVLESLDFHYKDNIPWWCIVGGDQQLARAMETSLLRKPTYDSRVTAIEATGRTTMAVKANNGAPTTYAGVFSSVPLGCLKQIDTSQAGLNYATRQAIRSLGYGAAAKVGMKFKKAWWIHDLGNYNIKKGGLGHSDLSIRTCVYPSYNYEDDADKSAVLLCSYTWQQDAQRMAAFISPDSPEKEDQLKELIFRDLARLHNEAMSEDACYNLIKGNYESHYAYDWYHDPNALGAFAFFRPGQFSSMWNKMIQPSGNLVIIGEAASPTSCLGGWGVGECGSWCVHLASYESQDDSGCSKSHKSLGEQRKSPV
ncbi:hypothetical protein N8T08_002721 [Aspergillus melleus]|uniref:Uncharacterized protein n=1 Tax=Aspergillus melleus TaxID=138277 RepID=A0ACC3B8G2_9EURO|nr:hypothetical protein N8T08_002721 [Aspergillus melleus]